MIIADANLLLYAYDSESPHHAAAAGWLRSAMAGDEPFGLATSTIAAFLRLATHPRILEAPLSIEQAIAIIDDLTAAPNTVLIGPGERHLPLFRELLLASRAVSDLVPDAYLAALALEHHAVVHTNDHDFDRFRGVRVAYPLRS